MLPSSPHISLFFPTYHDQESISFLVEDAVKVLSQLTDNYSVFIVDDGSPDQTAKIAEDLSQKNPKVHYIRHTRHLGYGAALRTGLGKSLPCDYLCFTDGDYPINLTYIPQLLPLLENHDGVITHRIERPYGKIRTVISRFYNFLLRLFFHLPFRDSNSPLKIFRGPSLHNIHIQSSSPFAAAELLIKALTNQLSVAEVLISSPAQNRRNPSYALRPATIFLTLHDMIKLWIQKKITQPDFPGEIP